MHGGGVRPRVRVLVHGAERSGPPIYVLRLVRWWASNPPPFGIQLVVARPGPLVAELGRAAPTKVVRLDRRGPERLGERVLRAGHLDAAARLLVDTTVRARVRGDEPDLTIVNGATAATVELLSALDPTGPVVTIAHELSTGWFANLDAASRSLLLSRSSAFLAVSESVRSFLVERLGVRHDAVTVLHPPVDVAELDRCRRTPTTPERPAPAAAGQIVAGSGVTDWRKAPELWLRVAALVRRQPGRDHVRFTWAGGESEGSQSFWPLEHEMEQLDLRDRVAFLGTVEEPWRALGGATVMVSTAREDAYPLACAESIALGVPVVGFDVDGVGEMVRESGCGEVVPYPDDEALAAAVGRLLDDGSTRESMAVSGRRFGREVLDVSRVAPRMAEWILEQAR